MTLREYKLTYNTTTVSVYVDTKYINRRKSEKTVIKETPTGSKYKQVFGTGKVAWAFSFPYAEGDLVDFFTNGYNAAVSGYELTLSEADGLGGYDDYTVIINLPSFNDDVFGADIIYEDISIEVFEA